MSRVCLEMDVLNEGLGYMATAHVAGTKGMKGFKMFAKYMGGCGAGRCYCAIQPDGAVTPCVFMQLEVGDLLANLFGDAFVGSHTHRIVRRGGAHGDHHYLLVLYLGPVLGEEFDQRHSARVGTRHDDDPIVVGKLLSLLEGEQVGGHRLV